MSTEPSDDQPKHGRPILEYVPPEHLSSEPRHDTRDMVLGAVLMAIATFASCSIWIVSNIRIGMPPGSPANVAFPAACALALMGPLIAIAWYRWKKKGTKAFGIGLLIGFAVGLLLEGLCVAVISGGR